MSATRWSNGVPNSTAYDAIIDDGVVAADVTLDVGVSVNSVSIGSDDTLTVEPDSDDLVFTVANGFSNEGTLLLVSGLFDDLELIVQNGVLHNHTTGLIEFASVLSAGSATRTLSADLVNDGTIVLKRPTRFAESGGTYTNNGTFTLDSTLTILNGGHFVQEAGLLDVNTSLTLNSNGTLSLLGGVLNMKAGISGGTFVHDGGTLNYTSGTISGTYEYHSGTINGIPGVSGTLHFGPGASDPVEFVLGSGGILSLADDILYEDQVISTVTGMTVNEGFANRGTITVNGGGSSLTVTNGTLVNESTGLLHFPSNGGSGKKLNANLSNYGTILIDGGIAALQPLAFNKADGVYANYGTITVAAPQSLSVSGGAIFEQRAGTLDLSGSMTQIGGTFRFLGGTVNGVPIISNAKQHVRPRQWRAAERQDVDDSPHVEQRNGSGVERERVHKRRDNSHHAERHAQRHVQD
jgi:hypothetical protein